ncbi:MAG: hypothetical protein OXD38_01240 [Aestuariivita sp.]|nr:hypothetical protein [Aestuariivita sp.]
MIEDVALDDVSISLEAALVRLSKALIHDGFRVWVAFSLAS